MFSEVWWLVVWNSMCLQGLGSRKHGPPSGKPDILLSKGRQDQGISGERCSGGLVWMWRGCSPVSRASLGGSWVQDMTQKARV